MSYLIVFFVAMVPILELRGALPLAYTLGLRPIEAVSIATLGNMLPIPFVYFFGHSLLMFLSKKNLLRGIASKAIKKGHQLAHKWEEKSAWSIYLALAIFVAIPLPGSGVYTAVLAASILELDYKKTCLAAALGVLGASFLVFGTIFLASRTL